MSGVSHEVALAQVGRLECLPGFPKTGEGVGELARSLAGMARDDAEARRVVDECVTWDFCARPGDFSRLLQGWRERERARERPSRSASGCPQCGGLGWVITNHVVYVAGVGREEVTSAARCQKCNPTSGQGARP